VTFLAGVDLERLAKEQDYNIDNVTAICRGSSPDPNRRLRGFPEVFDDKGRVDEFRKNNSVGSAKALFEYHVYFDVSQTKVHGFYHYDLTHKPQNVCITIDGAQERLFWITDRLESEPLVVSEQEVATALAKAGLR
jgi:hypothetical protein